MRDLQVEPVAFDPRNEQAYCTSFVMILRALIFAIFVCVLTALYLASREYVSLDALIVVEARLHDALARHPWTSFGVGFAIYVAVSLVPGTTGKALIVGWLWGFWLGLVIVNVGLTVAAMISFWASRYFFHDLIESRFGMRLARVNAALQREGPSYLFAARVLHTPFSVTNYVMGATSIRALGFWWATQLGILPGNLVFVYAGAQVPTLEELSEQGFSSMFTPGIIVAFVAVSVLPLIVRRVVRRILSRARHRSR